MGLHLARGATRMLRPVRPPTETPPAARQAARPDASDPFACPRCAYDQSGAVSTWTDACPLFLRCAECGYDIDIPQVHRDRQERIRWWVEHARTRRGLLAASLVAPIVACAPWWLFRRLRLSHAPRFRRLFAPFAVYLAATYLVISAVAIGVTAVRTSSLGTLRDAGELLAAALLPARASLYQNRQIVWEVQSEWWRLASPTLMALYFVGFVMVTTVASTAAFAALPIARRRAKLRWGHLARASLILMWSSPAVALLVTSSYWVAERALGPAYLRWWLPIVPYSTLWLLGFLSWRFAADRHFRMRLPAAVAASVATIGVLLVPTVLFVVASVVR